MKVKEVVGHKSFNNKDAMLIEAICKIKKEIEEQENELKKTKDKLEILENANYDKIKINRDYDGFCNKITWSIKWKSFSVYL